MLNSTFRFLLLFFKCSLCNILQVYKCHFLDNKVLAVKIVKMEPQYSETQEVRLVIVMCIKVAACPVRQACALN